MSEVMKEWLAAKMSENPRFRMEVAQKIKMAVEEKIIGLFMKKIINEISRDQLLMQLQDYSIEDPHFECLALMVNEEKLMSNYDDFIKETLRNEDKDMEELEDRLMNQPITLETVERINKVKRLVEKDDFVPVTLKDVEEGKESFIKLIDSKCIN
jgi:hypothetical protein